MTRRSIVDFFTISQTHWSGRLQDNEFLARLYDLNSLPSHEYRYRTASSDIFQHRVRNNDWENDWVFHDSRFNLLYESDEEFLRFLCETVHPIVRPDPDEARKLVEVYNKELAPDGWTLVSVKEVSGKPIFAPQQVGRVAVFEEPTGWQKVDRQLQEVRLRLDAADNEEQYQAVNRRSNLTPRIAASANVTLMAPLPMTIRVDNRSRQMAFPVCSTRGAVGGSGPT